MAGLEQKAGGCGLEKTSKRMWARRVLLMLVVAAGPGFAQIPSHYVAIDLPSEVSPENVFIRYILAGEAIGGFVQPRPGVSAYIISTTRGDRSAPGIKAVLYAPGCAIQTLDLPLSDSNNPRYSFVCRPLGSVGIAGRILQPERLTGHEVRVQARYIARWAQPFLGLGDILVTIPVGDVSDLSTDYRFHISVPDLARDPLAGAPDHAGDIQIWAKDKTSGDDVAQLLPGGSAAFRTRMGGLRIQREYPAETIFSPCAVPRSLALIRRDGFIIRTGDYKDPC
jgi:hypothetical protein